MGILSDRGVKGTIIFFDSSHESPVEAFVAEPHRHLVFRILGEPAMLLRDPSAGEPFDALVGRADQRCVCLCAWVAKHWGGEQET